MSAALLSQAFDAETRKPVDKLILIRVANCGDAGANLTIAQLAKFCGCGAPAIRRSLIRLRADGHLIIQPNENQVEITMTTRP